MAWINWTKPATLLSSTSLSTSKHYADTTTVGSRAELLASGTWCYASSRAIKTATSFLHRGRGPYIVAEVLKPRTYMLKTADGQVFTNAWNIEQLRRFYP
jgi:hypothetical protein